MTSNIDLPFGPDADPATLAEAPIAIHQPEHRQCPIIVASPHSGRLYPQDFVAESRLDPVALRRSEDAFVDCLFADALNLGIPMLRALFPRALVDVNREALELDPLMFADALPAAAQIDSPRVAAGLGTIPRVVTNGEAIFEGKLCYADVAWRIDAFRTPYHAALRTMISESHAIYGSVLIIDAHSMPSLSALGGPKRDGTTLPQIDIVLGDGYGTTCRADIVAAAALAFEQQGLNVVHNKPYAGGYSTRHYGRPESGVHVMQIEINRALYLDEMAVAPTEDFARVRRIMASFLSAMTRAVDPILLRADAAAE